MGSSLRVTWIRVSKIIMGSIRKLSQLRLSTDGMSHCRKAERWVWVLAWNTLYAALNRLFEQKRLLSNSLLTPVASVFVYSHAFDVTGIHILCSPHSINDTIAARCITRQWFRGLGLFIESPLPIKPSKQAFGDVLFFFARTNIWLTCSKIFI